MGKKNGKGTETYLGIHAGKESKRRSTEGRRIADKTAKIGARTKTAAVGSSSGSKESLVTHSRDKEHENGQEALTVAVTPSSQADNGFVPTDSQRDDSVPGLSLSQPTSLSLRKDVADNETVQQTAHCSPTFASQANSTVHAFSTMRGQVSLGGTIFRQATKKGTGQEVASRDVHGEAGATYPPSRSTGRGQVLPTGQSATHENAVR